MLLGIAGASFERGSPPASAPIDDAIAFWTTYSNELIAQSVMFVLSAGAYLWFFASLRTALMRSERGTGTLSALVFAAGITSVVLQMVLQGFQVALATAAGRRSSQMLHAPTLLRLCSSLEARHA